MDQVDYNHIPFKTGETGPEKKSARKDIFRAQGQTE
jgi:hypothetical protein